MSGEPNVALVHRVMCAVAGSPGGDDGVDPDELFFFRQANGDLLIAVNCNDMFAWGCADAEPITEANIEVFEQAIRDVVAADVWGSYGLVFACRIRQERPQGALYKHLEPPIRAFVDACGPERHIDLLNPYTQDNDYAYRSTRFVVTPNTEETDK